MTTRPMWVIRVDHPDSHRTIGVHHVEAAARAQYKVGLAAHPESRHRLFAWEGDGRTAQSQLSALAMQTFGHTICTSTPMLDSHRVLAMVNVSNPAAWGVQWRSPFSSLLYQVAVPHVAGEPSGYVLMSTRTVCDGRPRRRDAWTAPFTVTQPERFGNISSYADLVAWCHRFTAGEHVVHEGATL